MARSRAQIRLPHEVDQDLVPVAVEHRPEVEQGAQVGAEGDLELDVAQRAAAASNEASAKAPPITKSLDGPAPLIAMRRPRARTGLRGVDDAYGKISTSLMPARHARP